MIATPRVDKFWQAITTRLFENKVAANADKFPWITREIDTGDDE
jgi:hypothetical protein